MIPDRLSSAVSDRYRVERELGQGGMATVYLAEDLKHKRNVALKVLTPELAAVLGADRFVQEITITASLQHPHIPPLFDSGTADGFLYQCLRIGGNDVRWSRLPQDESAFLMVRLDGGEPRPILVNNWIRVLRDRLAVGRTP